MKVTKKCPFCANSTTIDVDEEGVFSFNAGMPLQSAFPNLDAFHREVFKTGICFDCQEKVFNIPLPEHEKEWGTPIGECSCCGATIYSIRNKRGDGYQCKGCYQRFTVGENDELVEVDDE
jgi:hypothetical protein